jgi:hypothetical protein
VRCPEKSTVLANGTAPVQITVVGSPGFMTIMRYLASAATKQPIRYRISRILAEADTRKARIIFGMMIAGSVIMVMTLPIASSQMITSKNPMIGARYLIPLDMKMTRIVPKLRSEIRSREDQQLENNLFREALREAQICHRHDLRKPESQNCL